MSIVPYPNYQWIGLYSTTIAPLESHNLASELSDPPLEARFRIFIILDCPRPRHTALPPRLGHTAFQVPCRDPRPTELRKPDGDALSPPNFGIRVRLLVRLGA